MSYSRSLKNELIASKNMGIDELLGFALTRNSFSEGFILHKTPEMARYVTSLLSSFGKIELEVNRSSKIYFSDLVIKKVKARMAAKINRAALLRGLFLSAGCCSKPEESYAMEIKFDSEESLDFVISYFPEYKIHKNKHKQAFRGILRRYEDVLDILFKAGARESFFDYEEINIVKSIREKNNRETNLEIANNYRRAASFAKQIETIGKVSLKKLNPNIVEMINARKKYPDLSLQELASKLHVAKSTIKYRLAKLKKLAEEDKN